MKWFGRKAFRQDGEPAAGAARPALARGLVGGPVGSWPIAYDAQVREAYLGNPVAQRAVRIVAEAVGGAPLEASAPELGRLAAGGVLTTAASHLLLHGNAFLQVLRDAEDRPAALFPLRPERVSVEPDATGWPAAYLYRVGERVQRLIADEPRPEVIHLKSFHPLDDHFGLGCLGAAAGAVAIGNAATRWNKALLDNAARPSGALTYDPGDGAAMSDDQYQRLRGEIDAMFAGAANAGRPMLLEGGLSWQSLSLSPADMDFVGLKAAAARDVALAFGVPPMLLGLPGDATFANYKEANRALWRLTVLPLAGAMLDGIAAGLAGWFDEARLAVRLDHLPALAEERAMLWASVTAADFLSVEEKRAMVGLA